MFKIQRKVDVTLKHKITQKFLYRLFSITFCFAIITGCTIGLAEEKTVTNKNDDSEYSSAVEILTKLNILDSGVEYEKQAEVSRENMAYFAAKMISIEKQESTDRYFIDVPSTSYGAGAIEYLANLGVFSQPEDKCFHPDDTVTADELIKVITSLLGYDMYAKANGGYPTGYRFARQKAELYRISDEKITFDKFVLFLNSALEATMYEPISFGSNGTIEIKADGENILSIYHKTYISDGAVDAIGGISINDTNIGEDEISISGSVYELGIDVQKADVLGRYVKYYYKENNNNKTVKIIVPYNEETIINMDDVTSFDQSQVVYYKNDKSITKRLAGCTYVYNGSKLTSKVDETLKKINKGSIVLCDTNDDGTDDLVIIWNFKNFVVSGTGMEQKIISNKLYGGGSLKYDDYDEVIIYNAQNAEAEWSDILSGQALSVAESADKKVLYLIITDITFNGTLDRINNDSPKTLVINGEKYEVEKTYADELNSKNLATGTTYSFKLDNFGKIVYVESFTTDGSMTFAYVIDSAKTDDTFDEYNLKLKLILQDNKVETVELAEKVKIDGEVCKTGSEKSLAFGKNESPEKSPVGNLIRISKDSEGKIKNIDTPQIGKRESTEGTLSSVGEEDFSTKWYNSKRFGLSAYVDTAKTFVFCVPEKELNRGDEVEYHVGKIQDYFKEDSRANVNVYNVSDRSEFSEAIVYRYIPEELRKNSDIIRIELVIVDSLGQAMDKDGTVVNCINGMKNGSAVSINIPNDVDISSIGSGDIIKLTYGINDQIVPSNDASKPDVVVYYDYSKYKGLSPGDDWITVSDSSDGKYLLYESGNPSFNNYRAITQLSFGYAARKNSTSLWWDGVEKGKSTEMFKVSDLPIMIYDSNRQNGSKLYKGTINDIDDYEAVSDSCSRVILHTAGPYGKALFVYK